jgi:hypothetical protein
MLIAGDGALQCEPQSRPAGPPRAALNDGNDGHGTAEHDRQRQQPQ